MKSSLSRGTEFDHYHASYTNAVNDSLKAAGFSALTADFFARVKTAYLQDIVRRRFGKARRVRALDFGCGIGTYCPLLDGTFEHITGVDVSEPCIARARRENPRCRFEVYGGRTLPFPEGSFDLAYAITVLHHVPPADWSTVIAELNRVLKSGGLLVVFEHNPHNPFTLRAVNHCPFDHDAVLLKAGETEQLLQAAGFSSIALRYILTVPAKGLLLRGVDRAFARLPLGAQYYVVGCKTQ